MLAPIPVRNEIRRSQSFRLGYPQAHHPDHLGSATFLTDHEGLPYQTAAGGSLNTTPQQETEYPVWLHNTNDYDGYFYHADHLAHGFYFHWYSLNLLRRFGQFQLYH